MNQVLRPLRGMSGIGLTWGALWAVAAICAVLIIRAVDPAQIDRGEGPIDLGPPIGFVGFVCGVVFGGLLSLGERGKTILDLPLNRVAMWGVVVSAALPLVMSKGIPEMLVTVPLGAVSAMVSAGVARAWSRGHQAQAS